MSRISENIRKITKAWGGKTTGNGISDALSDLYNNLPFGVKTEMVEIVPEQSVTGENAGLFCILDEIDLPNANFTIGSKVDVVLNGTKYSCVVKEGSGDVDKYIGNFGLMGNGENTGEPFVIFISDALTYFWSTELGETITFAIYEEQEVVTQLDPKFVGASGGVFFKYNSNEGYNFTCNLTYDELYKMYQTNPCVLGSAVLVDEWDEDEVFLYTAYRMVNCAFVKEDGTFSFNFINTDYITVGFNFYSNGVIEVHSDSGEG